jgi:hypothetical protein
VGGEPGRTTADDRGGHPLLRYLLLAFLLAQSFGVIAHHPYNLSYYNLLVGGLPGAERLGLELAYWSDSVDRPLLRRLARSADSKTTAALAPTLAPSQVLIATGRALLGRRIFLDDEEKADLDDFLVVYRRSAYWKPEVRRIVAEGVVVAENSRRGVWLSRLIRRPKDGSPPGQAPGNR